MFIVKEIKICRAFRPDQFGLFKYLFIQTLAFYGLSYNEPRMYISLALSSDFSVNFHKHFAEVVRTTRGNQSFAVCKTGANLVQNRGRFFASSPTANLVGSDEEGHVRTFPKGCELCASRSFFVFKGGGYEKLFRNVFDVRDHYPSFRTSSRGPGTSA